MKSFTYCFRSYFMLIAILPVASNTIGCTPTVGTISGIEDAVNKSKADDAIVAKKANEAQDIQSSMELYSLPRFLKPHKVTSKLYWCYPRAITEPGQPSQTCNRNECCERVSIEEAPYVEFYDKKISLETEQSFIKRHRYLDLGEIHIGDNILKANDERTSDVYISREAIEKNFPERQADFLDEIWLSIYEKAFPNQKENLDELLSSIDNFQKQPIVAWVESLLPLYQQCADSTNCMNEIISKYLATKIKPDTVSDTHKAEFAYQFETRPNWCYLVFEKTKGALLNTRLIAGNTRLIDSMTSDSLTTLNPYDDIQKFRAKAEYTSLDLIEQHFHVEGVCSVLPTIVARKQEGYIKDSIPIILGWPRAQVPEVIAMMAEVELHELKQADICPVIDRSAEFTWYTLYGKNAITFQRIPQQAKSTYKTYDINCSHPYELIDYFKHPIPGTLVWNDNSAFVIADKTANFKSYTVLEQNGNIFTRVAPETLYSKDTISSSRLYDSLVSKCSCTTLDPSLPEKYKACESQTDSFTCCENLLRADLKSERTKLQTQCDQADNAVKASMQTRLLLLQNDNYIQRQIYARCGLDNTKAYDNIEKLFRREDAYTRGDYPSPSGQHVFSFNDLSRFFWLETSTTSIKEGIDKRILKAIPTPNANARNYVVPTPNSNARNNVVPTPNSNAHNYVVRTTTPDVTAAPGPRSMNIDKVILVAALKEATTKATRCGKGGNLIVSFNIRNGSATNVGSEGGTFAGTATEKCILTVFQKYNWPNGNANGIKYPVKL